MCKTAYTKSQKLAILGQYERGVSVPELCREYGISSEEFYRWRDEFGGWDVLLANRTKPLNKTAVKDQMRALLESEFVGGGTGPADLSENYKAYLVEEFAAI